MGFIKNIINSSIGKFSDPKTESIIKSVPDLFIMDILKIDYDSFLGGNRELNSEGVEIKTYRRILNYKECGLFDTVEVIYFSPTTHNVIFKNSNWNRNIRPLRKLADNLYLLLGDDIELRGRFNSDDEECIKNKKVWMGRMWNEPWYAYLTVDEFDNINTVKLTLSCDL
jgi:hypothetical protein